MVKSIIYLPDGTEIESDHPGHAIKSSSFVRCVNSGEEFTIGSVCANKCEFVIFDVGATLKVNAGDEITVYRDDGVTRKKMGIFILEKPSRPTANTLKLVGYDRVIKLDKDLTEWMASIDYNDFAPEFAEDVCRQCGLTFSKENLSGFETRVVMPIKKTGITGRKIMQWIGEMYGAFCRANADGVIELAWYTDSGVTIRPTGDRYYFSNGLKYEGYITDAIDGVKIRLSENENGALWPSTPASNPYIITGNAFLSTVAATPMTATVLNEVLAQIRHIRYTPCTLSIPACLDIDAGQTLRVIDRNGKELTVYVMTKRTTGQKDVIECTGSKNRNTANKNTGVYVVSTTEEYALSTSPDKNDGDWSTVMPAWEPGRYLWRNTKILYSDGVTRYSVEYYDSTWGGLESVNNSLHDYAEVVTQQIEGLQSQIDGQIQTWFYDYLPTNSNYPASEWTTTDLKNQHLGDLFYVVDNATNGGEVYRWSLVNNVYKWQRVEDTEVAKALELASQAKDIADGKRRVFVDQPYPPYDVGDLWAQGAAGDLMRCKTARASGSYNASDWEKASKYIDETKAGEIAGEIAQSKVDGQTQMDIFNKLTNNQKDQGLFIDSATGKIYINAEIIQSLEKLFAKDIIMTGKFECQAETYLPPTYDDCIYMLRHLFFPDDYPLPTGRNFDFNRDGKVDESDVFLMQKVVEGLYPVTSLGVSKTTATLTINMSDPSKLICISGYNMWGTKVEAAIGVDPYTCTYETKDYVRRMMRQDTNSTTLYRIVDGEQEYINPPMSFMAVYRTAERIMSKPVYTVLMQDGQIPTGYQVVRKSEAFTIDGKTLRQYWLVKN